jgi:hypothetical protein
MKKHIHTYTYTYVNVIYVHIHTHMYSMFTSFAKDPGRILHEDCGVKIALVARWKCFQGLHIA